MGVPEEGATMSDANKTGRIAEKGWLGSFNLWRKLRGLLEIWKFYWWEYKVLQKLGYIEK